MKIKEKINLTYLKNITMLIKGIYAQIRLKQLNFSDNCLHKMFKVNINVDSENEIKIDFLKLLCQYNVEHNYDFVNNHKPLFNIFYEKSTKIPLYSENGYNIDKATIDVDFYYSVLAHLHLFLMFTKQKNLTTEINKIANNRLNLINLFLKDHSFDLRNNYKQFINFDMQHIFLNKSIILDKLFKTSRISIKKYQQKKPLESKFHIKKDLYNEGFDITKCSETVIQHFEVVFKFAEILIKHIKIRGLLVRPVLLNEQLMKKKESDKSKTILNNLLYIKRKKKPY